MYISLPLTEASGTHAVDTIGFTVRTHSKVIRQTGLLDRETRQCVCLGEIPPK